MAIINDLQEWNRKSGNPKGTYAINFGNGSWSSNGNNGPVSTWSRMQHNSSNTNAPGGAYALDQSHDAALLQNPRLPGNTSRKKFWLAEMEYGGAINLSSAGRSHVMVYDRLVHTSGLTGDVLTEQTTNLPTPPLPRYTDGEGVIACAEFYSTPGTTTVTTMTIRYTNQDGVPNRISQPLLTGALYGTENATDIVRPFSLQDGDTGIRSVEGLTLAASPGGVGNFGITLMKPVGFSAMDTGAQTERQSWRNMFYGGAIVEVKPDACLALMSFNFGTSTGAYAMVGRVGMVTS